MQPDSSQRAHRLVEELRAEVDFEIDDVISTIVRNLPEEYFRSLGHDDQLTHLKALLAISICNLKRELTLRSDDDRHIAVVARQNYPGLLAKIISGLPDEQPLIGAKIFTSKTHDFIIDLFEFKTNSSQRNNGGPSKLEISDVIAEVAKQTNSPLNAVTEFVASYPPGSRVLESAAEVSEHWLAFCQCRQSGATAVRWVEQPPVMDEAEGTELPVAKITVSASSMRARDLFLATAKFLADHAADIDQAFLDDFSLSDQNGHISVASFLVIGQMSVSAESSTEPPDELIEFLRDSEKRS